MNLQHLGDALDHWKGSLLSMLQEDGLLTNLQVDAMASDVEDWMEEDWLLLAQLLRVQRDRILHHACSLVEQRDEYFEEIPHTVDVFLDPDTGIATGKVKSRCQYLSGSKLGHLLRRNPKRVVAVYQHIRAERTFARLTRVMEVVGRSEAPFSCCSYESGTVAMLFFSECNRRVEAIHERFRVLLGRHADSRTHIWRVKPRQGA